MLARKIIMILVFSPLLLLMTPGSAWAAGENGAISSADTTFIIMCTALVLLMTPALAFFYGGMVRRKNVLSIFMQCLVIMGVVAIQWIIIGYSLSFGPDIGGVIGNLEYMGLKNVGLEASGTIPHQLFVAFQMMFAILTAALIAGAFAERMRFAAFLVFVLIWTTIVYDPLCHWVWGVGGWIERMGALDFAGGTVVHISSGIAGLVGAMVLGKRKGKDNSKEGIVPHNLPLTLLGASLLWFGWIGFNAGSALAADGIAVTALLVTVVCAGSALLSWILAEWYHHGKPTALGAASGIIAGLVCITPAAGFVTPLSAIFMGLIVGPICYYFVSTVKHKIGYDDTLDVFGIHGVGGIVGALATGIFASLAVNPDGANGLLYGNPGLLITQTLAVAATIVFVAIMTYIILKSMSLFMSLRVTEEEEETGLDLVLHGEDAYWDASGFNS